LSLRHESTARQRQPQTTAKRRRISRHKNFSQKIFSNHRKAGTMALQMSLRRGASTLRVPNFAFGNVGRETLGRRYKSSDVGDVIGIDLGTTNSCVAIMVSSYFDGLLFL
jgi:hypothetical protein